MDNKKEKKAFIASITAIGLAAILILLWLALQNTSIAYEKNMTEAQPLAYTGYYFDNIFGGIQTIIGPTTLSLGQNDTSFSIMIGDTMGKANFTTGITNYKNLVETNFSARAHANITINISNITDGRYEMMIDRFQYVYNYTNSSSNEILFGAVNGTIANITYYQINVTTSKSRALRIPFLPSVAGDIIVTLLYNDNNGTDTEVTTLDSTILSVSSILYTDNTSININVGNPTSPGQLQITDFGVSPIFSFTASFPLDNKTTLSPSYQALLNYTQGKITRIGVAQR